MSFATNQALVTEPSLGNYFRERLTAYAQQLSQPPQEDTCWYLCTLLERFSRSEQLLTYHEGHMTLRPLALIYGDALQADTKRERCMMLQQLGDVALFLGALFPRIYARYGIFRDYFIGMGCGAYDYLAENARHNRHIFAELAGTFTHILPLLANACSRNENISNSDILSLYQHWLSTNDKLAENQLRTLGMELGGSEHKH